MFMKKIILASGSPRRSELLNNLMLRFDVVPDNTCEPRLLGKTPEETVQELAKFKGENVAEKLNDKSEFIVISADTVVSIDGYILGKPIDEKEAEEMLLKLSGRQHCVYTGVYIKNTKTKKSVSFNEKTEVFFKKLDIDEIKDYISTGEPMDKAGSYGIQEYGSLFVEKINGDYFNVVGLPVCKLAKVLKSDFGIKFY